MALSMPTVISQIEMDGYRGSSSMTGVIKNVGMAAHLSRRENVA